MKIGTCLRHHRDDDVSTVHRTNSNMLIMGVTRRQMRVRELETMMVPFDVIKK